MNASRGHFPAGRGFPFSQIAAHRADVKSEARRVLIAISANFR